MFCLQSTASTSTRSEKKPRGRSASRSSTPEEIIEDNVDYYAHERKSRHKNRNRSRSRSRSQSQRIGIP